MKHFILNIGMMQNRLALDGAGGDTLDNGFAEQNVNRHNGQNRQQKGNDDLRDRTAKPKDNGVACILENVNGAVGIGGKELYVVGQTYEISADLLQTGSIVLKEAVVNG